MKKVPLPRAHHRNMSLHPNQRGYGNNLYIKIMDYFISQVEKNSISYSSKVTVACL